ncbi:toprim domain-containing protein [Sutterella sp.]|uniref:DUF7146 domain-containing protein n=1 Tax=Sutterella sp. TaxID=1981025 RepID=UPI0026DF366F|nr:toprim domain-containing protein [Sutterella sp.]MDO5530691.1 toprim domain-containing protein [Sutterella sp.]
MDPQIELIKSRAEGRWPEIFAAGGMDPAHFERDNRPCPLCGGRDRFSFFRKETEGRWFCRGCGAGDGIELLMKFSRRSFPETLRWLESYLGIPPRQRSREEINEWRRLREGEERRETDRLARLEAEWNAAVPLKELPADAPVRRYLASRGLGRCDLSAMLREGHDVPCWGTDEAGAPKLLGKFPAMIACVTDPAGKLVTLHRTFLTEEGGKAPVPNVKKLAPGSVEDGLVRLFPPTSILCLSEGIETALSVHELTGLPVWSAISLTGFRRFEAVPAGVERIRICGDNDRSFAGAAGAYELAARLRREHPGLEVTVHIPPGQGTDWNDVLLAGGKLSF